MKIVKAEKRLVEECRKNIDKNEMIYNETLNTIPLNDYKSLWFLHTIHSIICCIFSNKHSH